jgi:hypothetical protein
MKQHEAVVLAMRAAGGYATLGQLNRAALQIPGCEWKTRTPFASIRRIVQQRPEFWKIRPGLWALKSEEERIRAELALDNAAPAARVEEFNHSYYQGLLVELGNLRRFETFVPRQDANRKYLHLKLAEVATLPRFPEFTYPHILRHGQTVDVAWFNKRGLPTDFFEVEHSTDIQNSLLKFVEFQDFRIRFTIVADEARRREYEDKLCRAAFKPIAPLVNFLDYEKLSRLHEKESELSELSQMR